MSDCSDDESYESSDNSSVKVLSPRKAKKFTYKEESDSDHFEETQHDSDNDPDFTCSESEAASSEAASSDEYSRNRGDNEFKDDNASVLSNMTEYRLTMDMFNNNTSSNEIVNFTPKISTKNISKRKISEECRNIYGIARKCFWDHNYEEAQNLCIRIIDEYPCFPGSYDILADIYTANGNVRMANKFRHAAAMNNPKETVQWLTYIESTKELDGIDKAIEIAKNALARNEDEELRRVLIGLLNEGGYEKDAFIKRLICLQKADCATDIAEIEKEVEELFYMSEKFESFKKPNRAAECLETINKKYPTFLSVEKLIGLHMLQIRLKRFNKVLEVVKNIEGVKLNIVEVDESTDLFTIDEEIDEEMRQNVIFAILMAVVHLDMKVAVQHRSFDIYLKQLKSNPIYFISVLGKLFDFKFYYMVIENSRFMLEESNEKLVLLKFLGKSQEKLGFTNEALITYDHIINDINGKDPSIWELKAYLLQSLGREQDAINVLAESQKFVADHMEEKQFGKLIKKPKPTKDSVHLLCKLCRLLKKDNQINEFMRVAWKYMFIESDQFFKTNKIKLHCDDMAFAKANFYEITNSLQVCILQTLESSTTFTSSHSKPPYESEAWDIIESLLQLLMNNAEENMKCIEILSQWGLVMQKLLNWNPTRRSKLSSIYIGTAIINRLKDPELRTQSSSNMIITELKNWKATFEGKTQFWNMFNLCTNLIGSTDNRYILRCKEKTKNNYLLDIISAGYLVNNYVKLSIVANSRVHFDHPENAQICLQLAITYVNATVSRVCRDTQKPLLLALNYLYKYRTLRGNCQETWYNMGRFYHRINFLQAATHSYNTCIATTPIGTTARERAMTDLTREAAFNLVLIYRELKNTDRAMFIMQTYLTV